MFHVTLTPVHLFEAICCQLVCSFHGDKSSLADCILYGMPSIYCLGLILLVFVDPKFIHWQKTELVIGEIGLNFCFVDDLHMNHRKIVQEYLTIESDKELASSLFLGKKEWLYCYCNLQNAFLYHS